MSLYQKRSSNGIWWTRFWVNGREYRRSCETTDRKEADRQARKIRVEVENERPRLPVSTISLTKLAADDVSEAIARGATQGHIDALELKWAVVLRNLPPGLDVSGINFGTVNEYIVRRRQAMVKGQTIIREVQCLRRAVKIAKRKDMINQVPDEWPTVRRDPQDPKQTGKLWSPKQVRAVLNELAKDSPDAHDELLFAALTGLRSAEIKRVRSSWVVKTPRGASPAVLHLPAEATKSRTERLVGLSKQALEIIERRVEAAPHDIFVFNQADHKKARRLACERLKLPTTLTLRDCRHTFASTAMIGNGDLVAVQRTLGHKDLRTTEKYLSSTIDRLQGTSAAVGRALTDRTRMAGPRLKSRNGKRS